MATIDDFISTPGEILLKEFLEPLGVSQCRLAKSIRRPQSAVSDVVRGKRAMTAAMAWLLDQALGATPQFWLNLQQEYDLRVLDTSKLPPVVALTV
ncbi:HigA family addiction module antitoxin [Ellagibacter isourolithinifaciens]|uniref:HigA family addiction module antitoxin n=1 Tax=Ellagibacter isourolithinifaciens TaxID=2137581 RepID=UPI003A9419A4